MQDIIHEEIVAFYKLYGRDPIIKMGYYTVNNSWDHMMVMNWNTGQTKTKLEIGEEITVGLKLDGKLIVGDFPFGYSME